MSESTLCIGNIPPSLRTLAQFVVWRQEKRGGKPTKVPYAPRTGRRASSTDPATWGTFDQAVKAYGASKKYNGMGIVFTDGGGLCGVDIDDCLDAKGRLASWAKPIVRQLNSYTEISPSGRGLKIIIRGTKPDFAQCSAKDVDPEGKGEVEVYDHSRYFTLTGRLWPGCPTEVADRQEALNELCRRLWPRRAPSQAEAPGPEQSDHEQVEPSQVLAPTPRQPLQHVTRDPDDPRMVECLGSLLGMKLTDKGDGSFRLFTACCRCVEHDLSDLETLACIRAYEVQRPFPSHWSAADIVARLRDAERKAERGVALAGIHHPVRPQFKTVRELLADYPEMRPPVVHGLIRAGETMNIISAPKCGKSWLATDLALAIAAGQLWLGAYATEQGRVLILDNELHGETTANRIPRVAEARGISLSDIAETVCVENLRGRIQDIFELETYFDCLEPGQFKLIILDAFYRFVPRDTDENDNGTVAHLYNQIDRYADRLGCSFVLIHHASKGSQSNKSVTDVGAGAGSQSRATDTHLVLRPHEQDGIVVLDAAVRSWPPVAAMCLSWEWPVFNPAPDLDPTALRPERSRRRAKREKETPSTPQPTVPPWDTDRFVREFIVESARTKGAIFEAAEKQGLSEYKAAKFLKRAEATGKVHRWHFGSTRPVGFATEKQPALDLQEKPRE